MTLCVALRHKDGIVVGADSCVAGEHGARQEKAQKLFAGPNGCVMACCGSFVDIQYYAPRFQTGGLAEMQEQLRYRNADSFGAVLSNGKTIKLIDEYGTVTTAKGRYAVLGSAEDVAHGFLTAALLVAGKDIDLEAAITIVRSTMRTASKFDHGVRGPYRVINA